MSAEHTLYVRLPKALREEHDRLQADADAAWRRVVSARPGDRRDLGRYEALHARIEVLAARARAEGAEALVGGLGADAPLAVDDWERAGDTVVALRLPLLPGPTAKAPPDPAGVTPPPPRCEPQEIGLEAARARLHSDLRAVVAGEPEAAIRPSGIPNRILTESLREFVGSGEPVDAPVTYRDGSTAAPFPLGGLRFADEVPAGLPLVRCSLLSVRHPEMDFDVDGAWFRNSRVSRPRPAAETDELCRELTREGLVDVAAGGPVELRLHQTGLDSAIVGFYRALTEHLREMPGSIVVVPHYFRAARENRSAHHEAGEVWAA